MIALLSKPLNNQGAFLVRENTYKEDDLVLYVKHENGSIFQYAIRTQSGTFKVEIPDSDEEVLYERIFSSVEDLITFYSETEEVTLICTKLGTPCLYVSEWEIKGYEVDLQVCISSEDSGKTEVWKGVCGTSTVSAKRFKALSSPTEVIIEEIEVLKRLNQPNILEFYGLIYGKESVTIVNEFLSCKNLVEYFRGGRSSQLPTIISIIRQVLHGLHHLQQKKVVHLDIGARSVLFVEDPSLQCKLTNFGMARRIDACKKPIALDGLAIKWSAPEVINGKALNINTDVWSFGMFLYEIFTSCQTPYPNLTDTEAAYQIKVGHHMSCPANCPNPFYAIMKECWNVDPDARPSFDNLKTRMRELAGTLTIDGRPVPAPRRNIPQKTKPVPKPRRLPNPKDLDYENTTVTPNVQMSKLRSTKQKQTKSASSLPLLAPTLPPPRQKTKSDALIKHQVHRKDIRLVAKIRQSPWAEIWEGVWNENVSVSITVPKAGSSSHSEIIKQVEIMTKFQNPNVIKLHGVCTTGNATYVFTDLVKPGSLLNFLRDNKDTLQDDLLLDIGIHVARGMAYLHTHLIVHRDIRADNILIDENNVCKIAGLSLIKKVDETTHTFNATGTEVLPIKWAAPEVLMHGVFSTRSDVWSFGIFLYEIVTRGTTPYPGMTNSMVTKKIADGYRMPCPRECPEEVYEIMSKCWHEKPDTRPSSVVLPQMLRDLTEPDVEELDEDVIIYEYVFNIEEPEKDWNINFSDFKCLKKIQVGTTGAIWQGEFKDNMPIAIKCIDIDLKDEIEDRVEIMKQLRHPNLLELHGVCTTDEKMYIITEFMQNGYLFHYLQSSIYSISNGDLISIALNCAKGMEYLESKDIIHGNLSALKVLVGEKMVCKITGVCGADNLMEEDQYKGGKTFRIHPKWMALETAINNVFEPQSDIWSFGILLYEIMTCGQDPYPEMSNEEVLDSIARGYRMPCPPNCSETVYEIMLECWYEDPSRRPSFEEIVTKLGDIGIYDDPYSDGEEEWTVKDNDISLQYKLAESKSGDLWRGTWNRSDVAIMTLNAHGVDTKLQIFELMKKLTNPHILKVFGVFSKNQTTCIAMELMIRGNLQDFIAWEGNSLSFEKLISISVQCASGMAYLEKQDVIHGNLTACKVLVGDKLSCKITGIMGKSIESENPYSGDITFYIPYKWMPIETIKYDKFSRLSDIWSFGILLYEIITYGEAPYPGLKDSEATKKIEGGYRMPCPQGCPKDVHTIMLECWNEEPSQRPSFQNIQRRLEDICAYDSMPFEEEWPWNIRDCDLSRKSKVNDSSSGEVWSGILKRKVEVAIKCPTRDSVSIELATAEIMKPLKHPHILSILGICTQRTPVWICMEFMRNGNLKNFLRREGKDLPTETLVKFSTQCASGMAYLEEKDIIHGNLTSYQVLIGEDHVCKITGICGGGIANEDPYEGAITFFLPLKWRAPETIIYNEFTLTSDVWSFGIVLYEIMSGGKDPYSGMSNNTMLEEIQKGFRMESPPNCPRQVGGVMLDCWELVPEMRPKFDNITLRLKNQWKFMSECMNGGSSTDKEAWEVDRDELYLEKKISEGKTGVIWKGLLREKKAVAIHIPIEKDNEWIKAMKKLTHPHILSLEAVCITSQKTMIITEFMQNDNLVNYLRGDGRLLKLQQLTSIAVQISSGMMYLKQQGIVHRDLSARNVLVGEEITCKITGILADWTDVVDDPYYEGKVYTPPVKWAAPEAVLYGQFTFQSDVWSFGVVLYEIITYGRFPYPGMTRYEVITKIQDGYRMKRPTDCPQPLYNIMTMCWKEDPSERCSIEAVHEQLLDYCDQLSTAVDKWEINENDINSEEKIGEGEFGEELWKGHFQHNLVLIKFLSQRNVTDFLQEAEVLKTVAHPHVIKLHGLCSTSAKPFIVFDLVKHINLLNYLHDVGCTLTRTKMLQMSSQIANGMVFLQKQGIIHRNLSASNIMVSDDMTIRIANFSCALVQNQKDNLTKNMKAAKIRWMPVEVISNNQYSMKCDIWSYGVLLYELASWGDAPYPRMTDAEVKRKVPDGYRMSAPPACPSGLYEIMLQCWKENPLHRPAFNQLQKNIENLITREKKWDTKDTQVSKEQKLGTGRFGEVWSGKWRDTQIAVKYLMPSTCSNELFLWEAEIMKTLDHPSVIKLHAICTQPGKPFIVIEAMDRTLLEVLRQRNSPLKLPDLLPMAVQVTIGIIYLQTQSIIHRDLAARSILVGKGNICKVSDFSDAILLGKAVTPLQKNKKLPLRWTAPECFSKKNFSMQSDVWSFGILLYEMMTNGAFPYADIKDINEVLRMVESGYHMPSPATCPQNVYKVMLDCWKMKPENRPTFQVLKETLEKIQDDLKWDVEASEVKLVCVVGTGRFGEVWEGRLRETAVAVKYHKPTTKFNVMPDEFLWEAQIMKTLDHPYVIKLIGVNSKAEKVFMVTEFMKHGTLQEYLKSSGRTLTLRTLMIMASQVADGMAYLQTQSIIHRDLAARSILVGESNACKVSDFSEALCLTRMDNPEHKGRKFPIKWLPPEAAENNEFTMQTDIWSYGILLYEIVTNCSIIPYPDMSQEDALREIKKGYRLPNPPGCPEDIHNVMTQCWSEKPSDRPTFETVELQVRRISETCKDAPIVRTRTVVEKDVIVPKKRSWTGLKDRWTPGEDKWELDKSTIKMDVKYEEGRFGVVWKGYLNGSELVAIKVPKLERTTMSEFLHESEIMKMLQHPNVIRLRGVCTKGEPVCIITEFMSHSNMVKYLRGPGRRTAMPQLLSWADQICNGMIYLEQCNIIHRDVAARNVLVSEQLICKISDFGLAQKVSGSTYKESSRTQFPLKWMAPEAIMHRSFSVKSDVWAFGILLYEMVTRGALPYPGVHNSDVAQLIKAGYRMPCPRGCSKQLHEIMLKCWKENPEERPSFRTIGFNLTSIQ